MKQIHSVSELEAVHILSYMVFSQVGLKPGGFFILKENTAKNGKFQAYSSGSTGFTSLQVETLFFFQLFYIVLTCPVCMQGS